MKALELLKELNSIMEDMLAALEADNLDLFWELEVRRKEVLDALKAADVRGGKELADEVERARLLTDRLTKAAEGKKREVGEELGRIREMKRFFSTYKPSSPKHPRFLDIKE